MLKMPPFFAPLLITLAEALSVNKLADGYFNVGDPFLR
jgi:hypothetical protein